MKLVYWTYQHIRKGERSMRKWKWWLLTATLIVGLGIGLRSAQAAKKSKGLILDNARQYYSVKTIKNFIRQVHAGGGTFLQLHMTDTRCAS